MFTNLMIAAISLLTTSLAGAQNLGEMRMAPLEMTAGRSYGNQIGSSGLPGVHTQVLFGDDFDPANEPRSR
jgi:hypothetical protein